MKIIIYVYQQTDLPPVGLSAQLDKSTALESQRSWIQIPYRSKFFQTLFSLLVIIRCVHYYV